MPESRSVAVGDVALLLRRLSTHQGEQPLRLEGAFHADSKAAVKMVPWNFLHVGRVEAALYQGTTSVVPLEFLHLGLVLHRTSAGAVVSGLVERFSPALVEEWGKTEKRNP